MKSGRPRACLYFPPRTFSRKVGGCAFFSGGCAPLNDSPGKRKINISGSESNWSGGGEPPFRSLRVRVPWQEPLRVIYGAHKSHAWKFTVPDLLLESQWYTSHVRYGPALHRQSLLPGIYPTSDIVDCFLHSGNPIHLIPPCLLLFYQKAMMLSRYSVLSTVGFVFPFKHIPVRSSSSKQIITRFPLSKKIFRAVNVTNTICFCYRIFCV